MAIGLESRYHHIKEGYEHVVRQMKLGSSIRASVRKYTRISSGDLTDQIVAEENCRLGVITSSTVRINFMPCSCANMTFLRSKYSNL